MELNFARVSKNEGVEEPFFLQHDCVGTFLEFNREKAKVLSPIDVNGTMVYYEGKINVSLDITTEVERICSRCLEPYQEKLTVEDTFVFMNGYHGAEDKEGDVIVYHNDHYDITELVLDEAASQMTMKPLCSEGCKGLCPVCGVNKNVTDCKCELDNIDPRLQILGSLLNR